MFWLLLAVILFDTSVFFLLDRYQKNQSKNWKLVAEGVFQSIKYHTSPKNMRIPIKIGLVLFEDGKYCMVTPVDMPPPGTPIRIYKNGCAEFKIEEVKKTA